MNNHFLIMGIPKENNLKSDTAAIKQTIATLFEALRKGDLDLLKSLYAENVLLQSITSDKEGRAVLTSENPDHFAKIIGSQYTVVYNERVAFDEIKIEGDIASVWAPYKFFRDDKLCHRGVDVFELKKDSGDWKIIHIIDTRQKHNCF